MTSTSASPAGGPEPRPWASEPDAGAAVSVRGLTKAFDTARGRPPAVDRLDLDIPRGTFFGLVGRNGAGKTTALSMITGLLRPTAGTARVDGIDVWAAPRAAKAVLGVLPDGVRLFDRLAGRQLVVYAGLLRGMDRPTVLERTEQLLAALDLTESAGVAVQDYSAGMTKKIALAAALIHAPQVLVLDEPFEAVDPVSAAGIRQMLQEFVRSGGTVIVSSHVMDLVQRMCDHVAIMDRGVLRAAGSMDAVRQGRALEDVFVELVGGGADTGKDLAWLRRR